ncbi:SdrD B-like domain-containing protein [Candidatus Albibeggiatoa sp. nov. NOAA]|uniref:SdrD B-like domain-containing protein n=1 Tax=Candidatus Albibeggiatoa sp. nov. NOAA TaxID=3162724 RepID=UPI0032F1A912|nr:Ig-like domain-containing protein [Thiotrichaceae bacterium]
MSRVNSKLRASIVAALFTLGFSGASQASLVAGGTASSDAAGEYNGKLIGVAAGQAVSGTLHGEPYNVGWAGVIKLGLYDDDGNLISTAGTYCTDLQHPTSVGTTYNTSKEEMSCSLKYLVNNYPAEFSGLTSTEAAARQAAVWFLADGFNASTPISVANRKDAIVADVLANADCSNYEEPLHLSVSTNTVVTYEGETVTYTVSATRGGQPVAGEEVTLSTDFGALNTTTVTTDEFGEATFTVAASGAGTATIEATASYTLPAGVIFHALDLERQKLLLADSQEGLTSANTTTVWQVAEGSITVNIFHDRDINGQDAGADNGEEDLAGWTVKLLNSSGNVIQTATTDDNGLVFFNNVPNGDYSVTYDLQDTWLDTNGDAPVAEAGVSDTITVDNDSHYEDMGVIQTPFVDVCVYFDNNRDGQLNEGESLLSGWDVELFRQNGSAVVGASGTTNEDGKVTLTFHRHSDFELGGENYFTALIEQDAWTALQDADSDSDNGVATTDVFTLTDDMYEEICFPVEEEDGGQLGDGDEKCDPEVEECDDLSVDGIESTIINLYDGLAVDGE